MRGREDHREGEDGARSGPPLPHTHKSTNLNRIPQLHSQCGSWKGSLSAVLYLALQQLHASSTTRIFTLIHTIDVQATLDRLPQLHSQCRSWKGPLSAVLYLALHQKGPSLPLDGDNTALLKKAALVVSRGVVSAE